MRLKDVSEKTWEISETSLSRCHRSHRIRLRDLRINPVWDFETSLRCCMRRLKDVSEIHPCRLGNGVVSTLKCGCLFCVNVQFLLFSSFFSYWQIAFSVSPSSTLFQRWLRRWMDIDKMTPIQRWYLVDRRYNAI